MQRLVPEAPIHSPILLQVRPVTPAELASLIGSHQVLKRLGQEPKVVLLPGNRVLKLFRTQAWRQRWLRQPVYTRFVGNAARLQALGLHTVRPVDSFVCRASGRSGVIYPYLAGSTLFASPLTPAQIAAFGRYLAELHDLGVYFRGLHLENVIAHPEGGFSLIDVLDIRFLRHSLSIARRARNFRHLFRRCDHSDRLQALREPLFLDSYLDHSTCRLDQQRLRASIAAAI